MSGWSDFIQGFERHTVLQTNLLAAMYRALQQREAEKTPGEWRPQYQNLHNPINVPLQLLAKDDSRNSLTIYNGGPSVVLISNKMFDPAAVLTSFNAGTGGNYNEVLPISPIAVNSTQTLATTGPVYGYCVNVGTGANENANLTIIETLYAAWEGDPGHVVTMPGEAGGLLHGYESSEALDRSVLEGMR